MKRRITALVALLALLAAPAVAVAQTNPLVGGFTPAEKASMLLLRESLNRGFLLLGAECGQSAANAEACGYVINGLYETAQCTGYLMHVNVNPNVNAGNAFLATSRANVVANLWAECDRAEFEYSRAASTFAGTYNFDRAVSTLEAVDRSLPYATPWPVFEDVPIGTNEENQFGPHGHYSAAQSEFWRNMQYGSSALHGWLDGMMIGSLPACGGVFSSASLAWSRALKEGWFLSAHVIDPIGYDGFLTPAEEGLPDSAKRALVVLHLVNGPTDRAGFTPVKHHLRFVLDAAAGCLQAENAELYEFFRRTGDWWSHVDGWTGANVVIR